MNDLYTAFMTAGQLIFALDPELIRIVLLSLKITLSAVLLAALVGLPIGAFIALVKFPGRTILVAIMNAFMGFPPVVVGLLIYLLLSRAGPLGELGLLYTPTAMIIAQTLLVLPIIAALSRQTIADLHAEYDEQLRSFRLGKLDSAFTLIWDGRYRLITSLLAGFGRASAEVGAVMIVGGNINHVTRVMTTAIALETSKGNLSLALGLGLVLLVLILLVNLAATGIQSMADKAHA